VAEHATDGGRSSTGEARPNPGEKELPRLERGRDLTRIVAFTDGVFAIAITLLVLQIDVPAGATSSSDLLSRLGDQAPDFTAFAVSFAVIGMFWIHNHRFMRTIGEFDRGLMLRLLLYLGIMVLIPFSSQLLGEYGDRYPVVVIIYTANMIGMTLAGMLMASHVLSAGLARPGYEWDIALTRKSSIFTAAVFTATIPFAFVFGSWTPLLWLLLRFDPWERRRDRADRGRGTSGANAT
jgi:uncharacterized membrane protein